MAKPKRRMSAQQALEWAFRNECASLDIPERQEPEDRGFGFGMEYVLIQRAKLGGVKIDKSRGASSPHEDAEAIAAMVVNLRDDLGGIPMALRLAETARAGITPDWMPGAQPRLEPLHWHNRGGGPRRGKSELLRAYYEHFKQPHPKNPRKSVQRRRRIEIFWTPCHWTPTQNQIDAARRSYDDWWRALDDVRMSLSASRILRTIEISSRMPPWRPWLTRANLAAEIHQGTR